jgi:hypothetical protein
MISISRADYRTIIDTLKTLTAVKPNSVREYEVWRKRYLLLRKLQRKEK